MAGCSIINYKGKDIIYADHKHLSGKDLVENMKNTNKMIKDFKGDVKLLLADFNDAFVDDDAINYLKSDESKELGKTTTKTAVLGITGIKKIFLNTYNTITGNKTKAFDNETDAKEYLIS